MLDMGGFDKVIGIEPAKVIFDMTAKWVFNGYLNDEPHGLVGLGVLNIGTQQMYVAHWQNEMVTEYDAKKLQERALELYPYLAIKPDKDEADDDDEEDAEDELFEEDFDDIEDDEEDEEDVEVSPFELISSIDSPFFAILDIMDDEKSESSLAIGLLRTEDHIFYIFAPAKTEKEVGAVYALMYEQIYMICRTLAPQSDFAFDMADHTMVDEHTVCNRVSTKIRRMAVQHVEIAFCKNIFPSIKNWRKS